jgi:hypothetical protein
MIEFISSRQLDSDWVDTRLPIYLDCSCPPDIVYQAEEFHELNVTLAFERLRQAVGSHLDLPPPLPSLRYTNRLPF